MKNTRYRYGDVVYILPNIKQICDKRYDDGLFEDTISPMYPYAGKHYKVTSIYTIDETGYNGGAYELCDINTGQNTGFIWYDFHLKSNDEVLDINEVIK